MAARCLVLLLAVVQLASAVRDTASATVRTATNSTSGSFALAERQRDAAETQGCFGTDFADKTSTWQNFLSQFRTPQKAPRACARVWGQVTCPDANGVLEEVEFGDVGEYICGKNQATSDLKYFKDQHNKACRVFITKAVHITVSGEEDCKCQPCRFSVVVRDRSKSPATLWQTTWGPFPELGVENVWEAGLKKRPSRSGFSTVVARLTSATHSLHVWISGHRKIVALMKVALLVVIGVATGGVGSAAVVGVRLAWSLVLAAFDTYTNYQLIKQIKGGEIPEAAKVACVAAEGTKSVVGLVFDAVAYFIPFSDGVQIAAEAGASSVGTLISTMMGKDGVEAGADLMGEVGAGFLRDVAYDEVVNKNFGADYVRRVQCSDLIDVPDELDEEDDDERSIESWEIPRARHEVENEGDSESWEIPAHKDEGHGVDVLVDEADLESWEIPLWDKTPEFWKGVITTLYAAQNPEKLKDVDALMQKYQGQEQPLYLAICKKYKVAPQFELDNPALPPLS